MEEIYKMGVRKNKGYCLNQFSKPKGSDEFYTTMEEVEYIFDHLTEDFTNKIIYCPFDGDESNFVKYIKSHKNKLKYKDLWYTSDDWHNHLDLIKKADYIISNPPFSNLINYYVGNSISKNNTDKQPGILKIMQEFNCNFFLFGCNLTLHSYKLILLNTSAKFYKRKHINFIRPDGTLRPNSSVHYITNLSNSFESKKLNLTKSYKELNTYIAKTIEDDGLFIKRLNDIPYDYDEWMFVPITICFVDDNRIIYDENHLHKSRKHFCILNPPDGKTPYVHLRIKIKR